MPDSVSLGFNGLEAQPGTHICGIYAGERQLDEIVLPFLETGLRAGDKCMCIVDSVEPTQILAKLDPDLEPRQRADVSQLIVMRASHVFCRSGKFSADETIGLWKVARLRSDVRPSIQDSTHRQHVVPARRRREPRRAPLA